MMFGFLIKNEVNDDAVRIKAIVDYTIRRYAALSTEEARKCVEEDFDEHSRYIDLHECNFVYNELPDFQFSLQSGHNDKPLMLTVMGRGKYLGFMLQASNSGENWYCSAHDGIVYKATGGAKKLVQLMKKKFEVEDMSSFMKKIWY